MTAPIEIANLSLALLGSARVSSLDDDVKAAREIKAQYDLVRRATLRAHNWRFAIKRIALPALAQLPAFGFERQCQLPADCLRVVEVGDFYMGASHTDYIFSSEALFQIEGRLILTDLAVPLNVRYLRDVKEGGEFDALFVPAFAHALAAAVCMSLTADLSLKQSVEADYLRTIGRANLANAIEAQPEQVADSAWITARL